MAVLPVLFFKGFNCLNDGAPIELVGPLTSHEYSGTTCLQSDAANPESNTPPGISIHAP